MYYLEKGIEVRLAFSISQRPLETAKDEFRSLACFGRGKKI